MARRRLQILQLHSDHKSLKTYKTSSPFDITLTGPHKYLLIPANTIVSLTNRAVFFTGVDDDGKDWRNRLRPRALASDRSGLNLVGIASSHVAGVTSNT